MLHPNSLAYDGEDTRQNLPIDSSCAARSGVMGVEAELPETRILYCGNEYKAIDGDASEFDLTMTNIHMCDFNQNGDDS